MVTKFTQKSSISFSLDILNYWKKRWQLLENLHARLWYWKKKMFAKSYSSACLEHWDGNCINTSYCFKELSQQINVWVSICLRSGVLQLAACLAFLDHLINMKVDFGFTVLKILILRSNHSNKGGFINERPGTIQGQSGLPNLPWQVVQTSILYGIMLMCGWCSIESLHGLNISNKRMVGELFAVV